MLSSIFSAWMGSYHRDGMPLAAECSCLPRSLRRRGGWSGAGGGSRKEEDGQRRGLPCGTLQYS